jgi:hypothetical protein
MLLDGHPSHSPSIVEQLPSISGGNSPPPALGPQLVSVAPSAATMVGQLKQSGHKVHQDMGFGLSVVKGPQQGKTEQCPGLLCDPCPGGLRKSHILV